MYIERELLDACNLSFFRGQVGKIKIRKSIERNGTLLLFLDNSIQKYVLKVSQFSVSSIQTEFQIDSFKREVDFYNRIAPMLEDIPIVHCYDARCPTEDSPGYILLDDLSGSHFQTDWPAIPNREHINKIVDTLAKLHATYWSRTFHINICNLSYQNSLNEYGTLNLKFNEFARQVGSRIPSSDMHRIEKALNMWPELYEQRIEESNEMTLAHGDAHIWNFMLPREKELGNVFIVDWQNWRVNRATYDIAYFIGTIWHYGQGYYNEKELLIRYHYGLNKYGVSHYCWSDLWYDFRLFSIRNMYESVFRWNLGLDEDCWWPIFNSTLNAYKELNCDQLFSD